MTNNNIHIMDIIVDKIAHGRTISQALSTVYVKRSVAIPFNDSMFDINVSDLKLSPRALNALYRAHLDTVSKVVEFASTNGLMKVKTLGRASGQEIFEALLNYCWANMSMEDKTKFLIDTVERNSDNIKTELM